MTRCFCDLHIHTVYSDGGFTPEKVVRHAKAAGLNLIAVTDHDTCLLYTSDAADD